MPSLDSPSARVTRQSIFEQSVEEPKVTTSSSTARDVPTVDLMALDGDKESLAEDEGRAEEDEAVKSALCKSAEDMAYPAAKKPEKKLNAKGDNADVVQGIFVTISPDEGRGKSAATNKGIATVVAPSGVTAR